ncbi:FAD/NAD-P-binding domain-containing protein [Ceratobasidium sp. AG-I]|nr:FAD/NAD-P-binding domain-containing protein [Ceratobasidium sp. AG-I]
MSTKQNIVLVGSGAGGIALVQALQKQLNSETHQIVVIEPRDYCAHWPALIRASTTSEGSIEETGLIPTDRAFAPSVRVIHSAAKEINSKEVVTESGETVPYAQLVLATGSIWNGALALPDSRVNAIEHLRTFRNKLDAAQDVLIIGGGAVGIEYAGELRHYAPNKKVTMLHAQKELVNQTYSSKFRKALLDATTKLGVKVILGDRISPSIVPEGGYVTTKNGKRIRADFVINATGGTPNTAVVRTLDPSVVTKAGTVLVTPEFQVKLTSGAKNVWALGDIIEWPEQKMAYKALTAHAPLVAKNVIESIKGGNSSSYPGMAENIFITLGPKGGRGQLPLGIVLGDWVVSKAKSADLFITPTRALLGYKPENTSSEPTKALLALGLVAIPAAYMLYSRYSA